MYMYARPQVPHGILVLFVYARFEVPHGSLVYVRFKVPEAGLKKDPVSCVLL